MGRSKVYPTTSLPEAIELLPLIWTAHERKLMTPEDAAKALNYKGISGPSRSKISSLKQYGLLNEDDEGNLRLSERALVLLHVQNDVPEFGAAVRDAVSGVGLFGELGEEMANASPATIKRALHVKHRFGESGAKTASESFVKTMGFVSSFDSANMTEDPPPDPGGGTPPNNLPLTPPAANAVPIEYLPLPVLMDDGQFLVVNIPKMTEAAFAFFKKQLETYQRAIVKPEQPAPPESKD